MKLNIILFIIFICIYHYKIHNHLEKTFNETYFDYDLVKRPSERCLSKKEKNCIGMPSGHAETIAVGCSLLYLFNVFPQISLWVYLTIVILVSLQRVVSNMHSFLQIVVGVLLGHFYARIYHRFDLSYKSFLCIGLISLTLKGLIHYHDELVSQFST